MSLHGGSVAIIGSGFIGTSWALVFARAGKKVKVYDTDAEAIANAGNLVSEQIDLLRGAGAPGVTESFVDQMSFTCDLEEALEGASYVQECAPEVLETKIDLFNAFESIVDSTCILASSTSGITASKFTEFMEYRHRALVVHPTNPPHLIPLVEIAPSPWTSRETTNNVIQLMVEIGQSPIVVKREIQGFILNRLQGALLNEALRLAEGEYASTDDIDKAIRDGLGLRWSFMGPFETIDLNAPGGLVDYAARYGEMYREMSRAQSDEVTWDKAVIRKLHDDRRELLARDRLEERQVWRDKRLASLAVHIASQEK